jgi:hypothetical protein
MACFCSLFLCSFAGTFISAIMPADIVFSQFLPLLGIKIGRFVTNIDESYRDYCNPDIGPSFKVVEKVETQYDGLDSQTAH